MAKSALGQDLLGDTATAQAWLDVQLAGWAERHGGPAPRIELTGRSLRQLQQLRDRMRALLHGGTDANAATVTTTVDVAVTADGSALAPGGTAWPG